MLSSLLCVMDPHQPHSPACQRGAQLKEQRDRHLPDVGSGFPFKSPMIAGGEWSSKDPKEKLSKIYTE